MKKYTPNMKKKTVKTIFLYGVTIFIVFFPTYLFSSQTNTGQQILFLTLPCILFLLFILINRVLFAEATPFSTQSVPILLSGIVISITCLAKLEFLNFRIFVNHLRYFGYFFIFCIVYSISTLLKLHDDDLFKLLKILAILMLVFISLQLLFPSSSFVEMQSKKVALSRYTGFRVGGPLEWSYIYGFIATPIFFLFLERWQIKKLKPVDTVLLLLVLFTIILTQSKAVYINLIFCLIVYHFLIKSNYNKLKRKLTPYLLVFVLIGTFLIVQYWEMFSHVLKFIEYLQGQEIDGSTFTRLQQLSSIQKVINNNILFGYPKSKVLIENAYGHYFYYYGIIGLCAFILLLLYYLINFCLLTSYNSSFHATRTFSIVLIISALVISLSSSPIDAHKSSCLFFFFLAIVFAIAKNQG